MAANPQQLWRRETGQRVVAADLDEALPTDPPTNLVTLLGGSLVVPQDRGPQRPVGAVEKDEAVHLAGQADRRDRSARHAAVVESGSNRVLGRRCP